MGTFFVRYGQVEDGLAIISKVGIASDDFVLQLTRVLKSFTEISNIFFMSRKKDACVGGV